MTWYSGAMIFSVILTKGNQNSFPVYENIILVEASCFQEAEQKIIEIGKSEQEAGLNLLWNDEEAFLKFIGIRKIKKTHSTLTEIDIGSQQPCDGTEIISSCFELKSMDDVVSLSRNESVSLQYLSD